MVTIYGITFQLPNWLSFLSGTWGSVLGTIIASFIFAYILFLLLNILFRIISRLTSTEIYGVILDISRLPLVTFFLLYSLEYSLKSFATNEQVSKLLWAVIILVITYWLARLFKEISIYSIYQRSLEIDSNLEVILVPIINQYITPLIFFIGILFIPQLYGVNLIGLYFTIGGGALILGFALQNTLSLVFSGIIMLFDFPFEINDVLVLDDGTTAAVKGIGLRLTRLYDIKRHSDVFIPNTVLGGMKFINLTRPTPDLADSIKVVVDFSSDVEKVIKILEDIVTSHPDILGDIPLKLQSLQHFSTLHEEKIRGAREHLLIGKKLKDKIEELELLVYQFLNLVNELERRGMARSELKDMSSKFSMILKLVGLKPIEKLSFQTVPEYKNLSENNEDGNSLIEITRQWYKSWQRDSGLVQEDINILKFEWERNIDVLKKQTTRMYNIVLKYPTGEESLDYMGVKILSLIEEVFNAHLPAWKAPSVRLIGFGESGLEFEVYFYVDNMKLEHWRRMDRIKSDLRREISYRFKQENIVTAPHNLPIE